MKALDRVVAQLENAQGFKRTVNLRRVVIRGVDDISIGGRAGFARLTAAQQERLMKILAYVAHWIKPVGGRNCELNHFSVNLKILPATVDRPSSWYELEKNTVFIQIVHLSEILPIAYSYLLAHHDFVEHACYGFKERKALKGTRHLVQDDSDVKEALRYVVLTARRIVEPHISVRELITNDIEFQKTETKFIIHDLRVGKFLDWFVSMHEAVASRLSTHMDAVLLVRASVSQTKRAKIEYEEAVISSATNEDIVVAGMAYIDAVDTAITHIRSSPLTKSTNILSVLNDEGKMVVDIDELENRLRWIQGIHIRIVMFNIQFKNRVALKERFRVDDVFAYYIHNRLLPYVAIMTTHSVELRTVRMESAIVQGNAARFMRVIFNLVMNAVDAMGDQGGTITLSAENSANNIIIYVADTGKGMSEDKINQLLTPRRNLDGELHSLGFEFVKRTIASMGGMINVDSALGVGTTFKISLPLSDDETVSVLELPKTEDMVVGNIATTTSQIAAGREGWNTSPGKVREEMYGKRVLAHYQDSPKALRGAVFVISVNMTDDYGKVEYFVARSYEVDSEVPHEVLDPYYYRVTIRGRYTDYYEDYNEYGTALMLKTPLASDIDEYFEFHSLPAKLRKRKYIRGMLHDEMILIARAFRDTGLPAGTPTFLEINLENMFGVYKQMPRGEIFHLQELADLKTVKETGKAYDWIADWSS